MSAFDDRERALEDKFKHDRELEFRIHARRNRLLGLWAAQEMGLPASEHESYARSLVMAQLDLHGSEGVIQKLMADVTDRGVDLSEHRIRRHLAELQELARRQVMAEVKS